MHPADAPDWGSLHRDLLALCLRQLSVLHHAAGPLTPRAAAQLLASASVNAHWRRTALEEVGC